VRQRGRWIWVYAFGGDSYSYGGKRVKVTLVGKATEKVEQVGSFDGWAAGLSSILQSNPRQLVVLGHALSAALRRPLGYAPLMLALIAPTSTGKTTTQRMVSSMTGKPTVTA